MSDLLGNEFGNEEAIAYRAFRLVARELQQATDPLRQLIAAKQAAQAAFDESPTNETAAALLAHAQPAGEASIRYGLIQAKFREALQALTTAAAPPPKASE